MFERIRLRPTVFTQTSAPLHRMASPAMVSMVTRSMMTPPDVTVDEIPCPVAPVPFRMIPFSTVKLQALVQEPEVKAMPMHGWVSMTNLDRRAGFETAWVHPDLPSLLYKFVNVPRAAPLIPVAAS